MTRGVNTQASGIQWFGEKSANGVSDFAVDELLKRAPKTALDDEYPALTSTVLARREKTDFARRGANTSTYEGGDLARYTSPDDPNNNEILGASTAEVSILDDLHESEFTAVLNRMHLTDHMREIVELRVFWQLSMQEISNLLGTRYRKEGETKQSVDRQLNEFARLLPMYWLSDDSYGAVSVYRAEAQKFIYRRITKKYCRESLSKNCDCGRFGAIQRPKTGDCICSACGKSYSPQEHARLVEAYQARREALIASNPAYFAEVQRGRLEAQVEVQ